MVRDHNSGLHVGKWDVILQNNVKKIFILFCMTVKVLNMVRNSAIFYSTFAARSRLGTMF